MAEVLTWVMPRRRVLGEPAGALRKEQMEIETEVARLKAAELVIGQFLDAEGAG